jgi:hypothetical protein
LLPDGPGRRRKETNLLSLSLFLHAHTPKKTQLKHLGLRVKERYTTRDGLHARLTGLLDTVTGKFLYSARLEKIVGPPLPAASAPWRTKREALATPRGAVGLAYCSRRDAVLARAAAGGAADLGGEAWVAGKAVVEVDTRTQKARGYGRVSLSK